MRMYHLNHVLVLKEYGSLTYRKRFLIWTPRKQGLSEIFLRKYLNSSDICNSILRDIWNYETSQKQYCSKNYKLADTTPVYKKKDPTLVENYQSVSVFPCVSIVLLINFFSTNLCGYRSFFLNWDSLHTRLKSHYMARSDKKKKHKNIKAYRKSL